MKRDDVEIASEVQVTNVPETHIFKSYLKGKIGKVVKVYLSDPEPSVVVEIEECCYMMAADWIERK